MKSPVPWSLISLLLLQGASPATARQTLVPAGDTWKFLDDGSNQGTSWMAPGFDDASWMAGPAELGSGEGDEATVVGQGGTAARRFITTYFRKSFTVADPKAFLSLTLRLLRDDGAVVYLNGVEVRRDNLPPGAIAHTTLASSGVSGAAEKMFVSTTLPAESLVAGVNTLAVEVHQSSESSSDLSFNLELVGVDTPSVVRGPYLQQGTPTSLIIRWRTDIPTVGRVAYGATVDALSSSAQEAAAATTEHEVRLTGLQPDTRYFYSVGTPSAPLAAGPDHYFFTAPPVGTVRPTRIWVLGDSGTKNANAVAVRNAYETFTGPTRTDLWLMLGDNAYDTGTDAEYQAAVFDMYPAFLRHSVLWPTIGNHDTAQSADPPLTIPYFQMFTLPTQGEAGGVASGTEKYYSFDYNNIHFICLDSMTSNRSADSAMGVWLKNDLASTVQPWIIAFWHHPPYTKGSHDSDRERNLVEMREQLLPVLEAGGVDLVMAGHSHSYERSYLLHGHYGLSSTLTREMILNGGSGREDGPGPYLQPVHRSGAKGAVYITAGSSGQISGGALNHPAMFISLNKLGSMVLDVDGPRLDARFIRENGQVDDSFVLLKDEALASTPLADPAVTAKQDGPEVVFSAGGQEMFRYHAEPSELPRPDIRPEFKRGGYVFPLRTPSGTLVADDYPPNHLHHHGLWWAWTKTSYAGTQPDFWNMGDRKGRVEHVALDRVWEKDGVAGLTARHRFVSLLSDPPVTVLDETWELQALAVTAGRPRFLLDLTTTQSCAGTDPLRLPPYHYGGLGFRGRRDWDGADRCEFLTSEGVTDRLQGNTSTARWLWVGGPAEKGPAGVAILSHPKNFRAPQPLRLHPTEPFVCFAPQQAGEMEITPGTPYVARYRLVTADGRPSRAEIESWWQAYVAEPAVK